MRSRNSLRSVVLLSLMTAATRAVGQVSFSINESAGRTAISPLIYGVNTQNTNSVANPGLNQSAYQNLNLTFERLGGDRWTAYNYTTNASNAGTDYEYSNDNYLGGGSTPAGAVLPFLQGASGGGAIVTVPINGFVSADESGPISTPLAAPGSSPHFVPEYPTSAQDPAPAANHVYQNQFVQLVKNAFPGTASRPLVFDLDNEPDLWQSSHPEVHPAATTYAELLSDSVAYATMIKQVAPSALVYGPVSYGWDGFTSLQAAPDSSANGDFLAYYLKHMSTASTAAGVRLLDGLDLHWYPEATGVNASGQATRIIGTDTSPGVVAARLQAPRSLWDPTYVETSYISQDEGYGAINLINREQSKIAANYPGTKLAFGEYNYGAGQDISGGIAEADVLGILGKFGVYSANEWPLSGSEPFIAGAFQMFRNYDGKDSTFGDTEVLATNSDAVNSSVYASVDSTNPDHVTLVVINKKNSAVTAILNISNGGIYKTAAVYVLTSGSTIPQQGAAITLTNPAAFNYSMPAYSVTVLSLISNQWLLSTGGSWSATSSWSAGIPDAKAAQANFLSAPSGLTAPGTITLDGNHTVGQIVFNNLKQYTITPGTGGTLAIDDTGDSAGNNPSITVLSGSHTIASPLSLTSGVTIFTATGSGLTLSGSINGSGGLTATGAGQLTLSGTDTFGSLNVAGGSVTFNASSGTGILSRTVSSLTIASQLQVMQAVHANRTLLIATGLTLAGSTNSWTGKLDLTDNDMEIQSASLATVFNQARQGSQTAAGGIFSSAAISDSTHLTAIGVIQNSVDQTPAGAALYGMGKPLGLFDQTDPPSDEVLIKFTYEGDANLTGTVDGSDYSLIDYGFTHHLTGWYNGDFNYDGTVDGSDYALIDNSFNTQGSALQTETASPTAEIIGSSSVPEPSSILVITFTSIGLLRRRIRIATAKFE